MNTTTLLICIGACLGAGAAAGYLIGWQFGRQRGRDEQWVEDVLAAGRRDRERRDGAGRFRSLTGQN